MSLFYLFFLVVTGTAAVLAYEYQHEVSVTLFNEGYTTSVPGLGSRPSPWLFSVTIDPAAFGRSRDDVIAKLSRNGIESRPFFRDAVLSSVSRKQFRGSLVGYHGIHRFRETSVFAFEKLDFSID